MPAGVTRADHWLARLPHVGPNEVTAVLRSFAYVFCLLCGYYVVRPECDEMAVQAGRERLPCRFGAVFMVMPVVGPVLGGVSGRFARRHARVVAANQEGT